LAFLGRSLLVILDRLTNADLYGPLHARFPAAFRFLRQTDLTALADGQHEIDGRALFVSVESMAGRGRAGAKLEAHRRYIDIQVAIGCTDEIGLKPVAACRDVELDYDDGHDCSLFRDPPESWVVLPPGSFAVFFPDDGHAPLAGTGPLRKAVVKVLVDG
jgi:biofilm protein TabA